MRDIPQLGSCLPDDNFLETLSKAMKKSEKGEESEENKPFHVRKAAYDVILAARDGWLRSPELRQKLEELDFPRQLHSVVLETGRSDYQRSFLMMMEILSEDRYWHSYLRDPWTFGCLSVTKDRTTSFGSLPALAISTPRVRRFQPSPRQFLGKTGGRRVGGSPRTPCDGSHR
jgi:hypothetical protein